MLHQDRDLGWKRKGNVAEVGAMGIGPPRSATYLCLQDLLKPITCIYLSFDDGVSLCTPSSMAQPVGQHSVHNEQLRLHGNVVWPVVKHAVYYCPVANQELHFKWRVIIHKGWQGFATTF